MHLILALSIKCFIAVIVVRYRQLRADARRRDARRAAYLERKRREGIQLLVEEAGRYFPFAAESLRKRFRHDEPTEDGIRAVLLQVPGIYLGEARIQIGD